MGKVGSLLRFESDFFSDCFRQVLKHLFVSQKNGPDLRELILNTAESLVRLVEI